ncbi:MAG: DNA-protecting protein DprA [Rhizobiales bacterium]|nr:DNA-protecting protein DprA [Hyphomicrobiales bacterium]
MRYHGSAIAALEVLPELARRGGGKSAPRVASRASIETEIDASKKIGAKIIVIGDGDYPLPLAELDPPPPVISIKGDTGLFTRPAIAIVGARNASAAGCKLAGIIAHDLSVQGYNIVSGLARGIDTAAHRAALEHGTIAVIAGGQDIFYPSENRALQSEIGERGLVVSEMPPGTSPQARHFPRRNRIISGLSLGVVVVEAALRSGSLITARLALEQGRDVMAVPGSPIDPRASGANKLIKDGAPLVETAEDVMAAISTLGQRRFMEPPADLFASADGDDDDGVPETPDEDARKRVISALGPSPTPLDDVIRQTGFNTGLVRAILLELDLAGRLRRDAGDRVSLLDT